MQEEDPLWSEIESVHPDCLTGGKRAWVVGTKDRDGKPLLTVLSIDSGLVRTDPRPMPDEIRYFYEEEYRVSYKGASEPKPKHVARGGLVALSRYKRLREFLPEGSRVLDAGSGGGEFLCLLDKHRGCAGLGIEPNEGYADYSAREYGLNITKGFFTDVEPDQESVDMVTLFHVLEHVEEPIACLKILASWLRPGGLLVVEVPNAESKAGSPSGKYHFAHLFNYNLTTLAAIGRQAGLAVERKWVSSDGGNIEIVFRKTDSPPAIELEGNAERVLQILQSHTSMSHLFSAKPFVRPIRKLLARVGEKRLLVGELSGRALLDSIYRQD